MSGQPQSPLPDGLAADDAFDRRLRMQYWEATTQLSARTRSQLQQRLRTATSKRAPAVRSHRLGWSLAAACSLALVFGVGQRWQQPNATGARSSLIASSAGSNDQLVATLDETPDLYLWVASGDATAMTSE